MYAGCCCLAGSAQAVCYPEAVTGLRTHIGEGSLPGQSFAFGKGIGEDARVGKKHIGQSGVGNLEGLDVRGCPVETVFQQQFDPEEGDGAVMEKTQVYPGMVSFQCFPKERFLFSFAMFFENEGNSVAAVAVVQVYIER